MQRPKTRVAIHHPEFDPLFENFGLTKGKTCSSCILPGRKLTITTLGVGRHAFTLRVKNGDIC